MLHTQGCTILDSTLEVVTKINHASNSQMIKFESLKLYSKLKLNRNRSERDTELYLLLLICK